MMAPVTSPKPPMMVAANAFSAMVEPIWIETNRIGRDQDARQGRRAPPNR